MDWVLSLHLNMVKVRSSKVPSILDGRPATHHFLNSSRTEQVGQSSLFPVVGVTPLIVCILESHVASPLAYRTFSSGLHRIGISDPEVAVERGRVLRPNYDT